MAAPIDCITWFKKLKVLSFVQKLRCLFLLKTTLVALGLFSTSLAQANPHTFHRPQDFIESLKGVKNPGEQVFNHFCVSCHGENPAIPLGAPRMHHEGDWTAIRQKPLSEVLKIVYEGNGPMPPRGGCFECSDALLKAAVAYMMQ